MAATTAPAEAPPTAPVPDYVARFPMSYEDFLVWDHEGGLAEWVNGAAYLYRSTTELHQRIVEFLLVLIRLFTEMRGIGRVIGAPYAMRALPNGPAREPDVMFVATEHRDRIRHEVLVGAADLVVEGISEDSPRRDRADKFDEYQDAGVREYWLIDARPNRRRADCYVLAPDGRFQSVPVAPDGTYHATVLPGLWIRIEWLWQEEPIALAALREILGTDPLAEAPQPPASPA